MKRRELINLGVPKGVALDAALELVKQLGAERVPHTQMREHIAHVVKNPASFRDDARFGSLATAMLSDEAVKMSYIKREKNAPWRQWGANLEPEAVQQLHNACELPVAIAGALMPDAHVGYGLPIGGVLATENAVIPYAVGVDIACRVRLSVLDLPASTLTDKVGRDRLRNAIERETSFGIGAAFKKP
ncbi:MAG TPA: RtcB family protein, partial [Phycisphaerales bacterium]|nr:RtcB family protein [Phycisphaerales bacterium]